MQDLESAVDKMRQQQEFLQKKLKDEQDKKVKLEVIVQVLYWKTASFCLKFMNYKIDSKFQRDMKKEQHRIKELEEKTEQQAKVLKVKTEEMVAVHKRLRTANQMSR